MSVVLHNEKYAYFPVPKCACTSLKSFFFEVENGYQFKPFIANGRKRHIHGTVYATKQMTEEVAQATEGYFRVAVLRDPVKRLLSCYSNRVINHGELDRVALSDEDKDKGMTTRPTLSIFLRFLKRYQQLVPVIAHHSRLLSFFLGTEPKRFARFYDISQLDQLVEDFAKHTGRKDLPKLNHFQNGGTKLSPADLSPQQLRMIEQVYAQDYDLFGRFFRRGDLSRSRAAQFG